jgi:hypothetical protein
MVNINGLELTVDLRLEPLAFTFDPPTKIEIELGFWFPTAD